MLDKLAKQFAKVVTINKLWVISKLLSRHNDK